LAEPIAGRESLPDRRRDRVRAYLAPLGRLERFDHESSSAVADAVSSGAVSVFAKTTSLRPGGLFYAYAKCLLETGMPSFSSYNVYDFVMMHWRQHPEHDSYLYIGTASALAWGGYGEKDNKATEQVASEFLTRRRARGQVTVLALKVGAYGELEDFAEQWADETMWLGPGSGKRDGEETLGSGANEHVL
jgi:hypothetical protein